MKTSEIGERIDKMLVVNESKYSVYKCNKEGLKADIHILINQALTSQLEELEGKIEKLRSECTCGCNFKDGCLCKEEKRGFDKCKVQVKSIIKEIKEK